MRRLACALCFVILFAAVVEAAQAPKPDIEILRASWQYTPWPGEPPGGYKAARIEGVLQNNSSTTYHVVILTFAIIEIKTGEKLTTSQVAGVWTVRPGDKCRFQAEPALRVYINGKNPMKYRGRLESILTIDKDNGEVFHPVPNVPVK